MIEDVDAYIIDYFYDDIVLVKVRKLVSDTKNLKRIIGEVIISKVDGVDIGENYDDLYPISEICNKYEIIDKIFKHI